MTSRERWFETGDGRRLFAEVLGAGAPTVVFEAGMGASRNTWGAVVESVAERTTAVVYDRSGLGRSEPDDSSPRDLDRLASDLVDVLDRLGEGPFVLVGHSWGGPIVRVAASRRPDRICGLVLVDQTDENCELFFSEANRRQTRFALRTMPWLARLGVVRLMSGRLARRLPEPWATNLRAEDGTVGAVAAQLAELRSCGDDLSKLRDDPLALPDVPVVLVSGTRPGFGERRRRPELLLAHRATADAAPRGRYVEAGNSSHYVPFTDPEIVAREVTELVDRTRLDRR